MRIAGGSIDRITEHLGSPVAVLAALAVAFLWLGGSPSSRNSRSELPASDQHGHDDSDLHHGVLRSTHQNKDARAMQLKLDELVRSVEAARNSVCRH
jgi:low affinity Fe/Cu permease